MEEERSSSSLLNLLRESNKRDETKEDQSLPDDMIFQILLRLQGKSIFKFKCVSKTLNTSILSNPLFHHNYFMQKQQEKATAVSPLTLLLVFGVGGIWTQVSCSTTRDFTSWANWNSLNLVPNYDDSYYRILCSPYSLLKPFFHNPASWPLSPLPRQNWSTSCLFCLGKNVMTRLQSYNMIDHDNFLYK